MATAAPRKFTAYQFKDAARITCRIIGWVNARSLNAAIVAFTVGGVPFDFVAED